MRIHETCPICSANGELQSVGAFGWVAHCSSCFDADPDDNTPRFRTLRGHGETREQAIEAWLEDARELAAVDEIPKLRAPYAPSTPATAMFLDLEIQVRCEAQLQRGFDLVEAWRWWPSHDHPERKAQDIIYVEFQR